MSPDCLLLGHPGSSETRSGFLRIHLSMKTSKKISHSFSDLTIFIRSRVAELVSLVVLLAESRYLFTRFIPAFSVTWG